MNSWIRTSLVVGALSAALLPSRSLWAAPQDADDKPKSRSEMFLKHMRKELDLSDAQFDKVKAAFEDHEKAAKPLERKVRNSEIKLKDLVEDKAGDDDLNAALDSLSAARKDLRAEMDKFHESFDGILTPTQRAEIAVKMHEGWEARMQAERSAWEHQRWERKNEEEKDKDKSKE